MEIEFKLWQLTSAELIWLWRRRHPSTNGRLKGRGGARMSMNEAAALLSLETGVYANAENGQDASTVVSAILEAGGSFDMATRSEKCALARRRSGDDVDSLCRALGGISKPTFFVRENEANPEIVRMWEARGFSF